MEKPKSVDLLVAAEDSIVKIGEHSVRGAYDYWERHLEGQPRLVEQDIELRRVTLQKKRATFDFEQSFDSDFYDSGHLKIEEVQGKSMHITSVITLDFDDVEEQRYRLTLSKLTPPQDTLLDFIPKEVVQLSLSHIEKPNEIGGESKIEVRWVQEIAKSTYMPLELEDTELLRERLHVGKEMLQIISSF